MSASPSRSRSGVAHLHRHFRRTDAVLAAALARMEFAVLRPHAKPDEFFAKLCQEIIYQQLAGSAAKAIHERFLGIFPGGTPTPKRVLATPETKLRKMGLSWAKARYVRDLALQVDTGAVRLERLSRLDDEAAIIELSKVKGIGRWTAEMFLIFTLGREDVFSFGDLGLQKGMRFLYGPRRTRTRKSIERIAARWAPYRSYGSLALWHALDSSKKKAKGV